MDSFQEVAVGTLKIKIIDGNLIRDTEISGKMDPFVTIDFQG